MWPFTGIEQKIKSLQTKLKDSFSNVKQDTDAIKQWITYFDTKTSQQGEQLKELRESMQKLHNEFYKSTGYGTQAGPADMSRLRARVRELDQKVNGLKTTHEVILKELFQLKSGKTPEKSRYVESMVKSVIDTHTRISEQELSNIIVNELGLCNQEHLRGILHYLNLPHVLVGTTKFYLKEPHMSRKVTT